MLVVVESASVSCSGIDVPAHQNYWKIVGG